MMSLLRMLLLASAMISVADADDWPTHLHDNQRSGTSEEQLRLPLELAWKVQLPTPKPAWPAPAKQDYWNRKTDLRPRIVHDRANSVVVAQGKLIAAASADDQIRAFDARTGELLWNFFAEGPVRLAPTIWQNIVVFGADDGYLYGVALETGLPRWKTRPPQVGERRIAGNGRIISERPIRSGVLINDEGTGFFTAGIFPLQGAYFYSVDVRNGKVLDHAPIEKSVQGYLQQRTDGIFAATGRDPKGTKLRDDQQQRAAAASQKSLDTDTFSSIADGNYRFLGQNGKLVATDDDEQIWSTQVDGSVYCQAIANGYLYASTDSGWLYAYKQAGQTSDHPIVLESEVSATPSLINSQHEQLGQQPGYVLFVDPQTDEQIQRLLKWTVNSQKQVVVAATNEQQAKRLRTQIGNVQGHGKATVHLHETPKLPYASNTFDRIFGGKVKAVERLLMPMHGIAECEDGVIRNKQHNDSSVWSHTYGNAGNTASSTAQVGGGSMQLQWFGGPGPRKLVDRHMRTMPPLANGATLYMPGLDRVIAVNAFTGNVNWEVEIPGSTRIGILKDCGWMVARDESLLVAVRDELSEYVASARGGGVPESQLVHKVPFSGRDWGYLANVNEYIVGSSVLPDSSRRTIARESILEGAYSDNRPIVCSDGLFAFNDSERSWTYPSRGAILNPSIATTNHHIVFIESSNSDFEKRGGRIALAEFLQNDPQLVAIDLQTGTRAWNVPIPPIANAQNAYVLCDHEHVVLVSSRNDKTVHYDSRVFWAEDGSQLWETTQDNRRKPGGDHGEQDKHPVLVGNRLVVEPFAYDVATGKKLDELNLEARGYGCGTISASADALFFRSGNPARYSLASNTIERVTSVTRPGCWINMIPASGLLLIPEGSSGCTCNFAVQTSMALTSEE